MAIQTTCYLCSSVALGTEHLPVGPSFRLQLHRRVMEFGSREDGRQRWGICTGAPMKVQQELMRDASVQSTMNVYGQAMLHSKRSSSTGNRARQDRKSTRLNSSHRCISYAVFCLKKKT